MVKGGNGCELGKSVVHRSCLQHAPEKTIREGTMMALRMILRRNGARKERYEEGTMGTSKVRKERWEWMISGRNVGKEWCEEGSLGPTSIWRGKKEERRRGWRKEQERARI
jgi:hypothetical protein